MPMPWTYRHSHREWRAFLDDAKDEMALQSDNNTYTAVQGVMQVFRRRLTPQQGMDFATVLPCVPRAIFVENWDLSLPKLSFGSIEAMAQEVKALRPHHNLTPDNAIQATSFALWRSVRHADLSRVLERIGQEAVTFWHVDVDDPRRLEQRIV